MAASNKIQVGYIEAQDGAQFEVDAGTAAAPGLCFDDSAATGLYSPGTGQLAFSTSSKQTALRILADGKVGIDCSPTVALEVNGTIKASAIDAPIEGTLDDWIVHAGDTNTKFGFPSADTFSVETAGQQNLQVTGTRTLLKSPSGTNTTVRLQHQGNSGYGDIILDRSVNAFIIDNDPSNASNNQSYFSVKNKGTENLRIHHDGKLSVGTASAGYGQWSFVNLGSSGGDAAGGETGLTIRSDEGFTNTDVTGSDNWTLKLRNNAYAGGGVTGNQGTVSKILFSAVTSNGHNSAVNIGCDTQGTGGSKGDFFVVTGGAERLRINNSGVWYNKRTTTNANLTLSRNESVTTTNVAIGVVDFACNTAHTVQARIMGKTLGTSNVGGDLVVETRANGASLDERVRVTGGGYVSIGAGVSPGRKVHIKDAGQIKLENTSTGGWIGLDLLASSGTNNYDGYLGLQDSDGLFFIDNNSNGHDLQITQGGQLRIPQNGAQLCWGASQQFKMYWENSEDRMYLQGDGAYGLAFRVNGGNRLEINKTTGDVTMQGASGRNCYWDNSNPSLYLTDNGSGSSAILKIGTGADLQLYHDVSGTNHITCANNHTLKHSALSYSWYDYAGTAIKMELTAGGQLNVTNGIQSGDAAVNCLKSAGDNTNKAIIRVGYDTSNCLELYRVRNDATIFINANQSGSKILFETQGHNAMFITEKQSVHIAKLVPKSINWSMANVQDWRAASYWTRFYMTFSAPSASSVTFHVARMITQADWGFQSWTAKQVKTSYSPDSNTGTKVRYYGYYGTHSEQIDHINERGNLTGTYSNNPSRSQWIAKNSNLGPGGSLQIHESANGGYYRNCWATDYYVQFGGWTTLTLEIDVEVSGGHLWDNEWTAQQIYPAAFGSSASQSDADNWNGAPSGNGRGIWFNVDAGLLFHQGSANAIGDITGY